MKQMIQKAIFALLACVFLGYGLAMAQQIEVLEVEGDLERAVSPVDLVKIEAEGRLTMRALAAFGLLPDSFMDMAMALRRQGTDLLAASVDEVLQLQESVEEGALAVNQEAFSELLAVLDGRDYLEWASLEGGEILGPEMPLLTRGEGRIRGRAVDQPHLPIVLLTAQELNAGVDEIVLALRATVPNPPEVSEKVTAKMGGWLSQLTYASLSWRFEENGRVIATMTGALVDDVFGGESLTLGDLEMTADPLEEPGVWAIAVALDAPISPLVDARNQPDLTGTGLRAGVVWSEQSDRYIGAHLAAANIELTDRREQTRIEGLDLSWSEMDSEDGRADGSLMFAVASFFSGVEGRSSRSLGETSVTLHYQDYDLEALEEIGDWIEQGDLERLASDGAAQLQRMISAVGHYDLDIDLRDVRSVSRFGRQVLNLAGLQVQTRSGVSPDDPLRRDSFSRYLVEGLNYAERDSGITAERLQFSVGLSGFKPGVFAQVPFSQSLEDDQDLIAAISSAFSSLELAAESGIYMATDGNLPLFSIHGAQASLNMTGFDTDRAHVAFDYGHSGFSFTDISAELAPESMQINLGLEQIPWPKLVSSRINDDVAGFIAALDDSGTRLVMEALSIALPVAALDGSGTGTFEGMDPSSGEPVFRFGVELNVQSIVAFANAMREQLPERERDGFNQFMAMLMGVAEEAGPDRHRFEIQISSQGEFFINGNDLSPLLQ